MWMQKLLIFFSKNISIYSIFVSGQNVSCFSKYNIYFTCIFVEKMWMQKLLIFFSKNISIYSIFNNQSFKDMLTDDIVSLNKWAQDNIWKKKHRSEQIQGPKKNEQHWNTALGWSAVKSLEGFKSILSVFRIQPRFKCCRIHVQNVCSARIEIPYSNQWYRNNNK